MNSFLNWSLCSNLFEHEPIKKSFFKIRMNRMFLKCPPPPLDLHVMKLTVIQLEYSHVIQICLFTRRDNYGNVDDYNNQPVFDYNHNGNQRSVISTQMLISCLISRFFLYRSIRNGCMWILMPGTCLHC